MILDEYHKKPYAGHPGYEKMITKLRKEFFFQAMKKEVEEYLSKCLECQQVMVEHEHPARLLNPLPILEWKWELISVDFITGLPKNKRQHDSIMVVVDTLSKGKYLITIEYTYETTHISNIFYENFFNYTEY